MKRVLALIMALAMLLGPSSALADSSGTEMIVDKLRFWRVEGKDKTEEAKLHDTNLIVSMGGTEGIPTLQVTLDYGDGQQMDSVVQLVDTRLYLCLGGVSGTYYVDLDKVLGEAEAKLFSTAFGTAMMMLGTNPELVLHMLIPPNEAGKRIKIYKIPASQYRPALKKVIKVLKASGAVPKATLKALNAFRKLNKKYFKIKLEYRSAIDRYLIKVTRDGVGYQMRFRLAMTTGEMGFINISADELQYDLTDLSDEVKAELTAELEYLAFKMGAFVDNTNLKKLNEEIEATQTASPTAAP